VKREYTKVTEIFDEMLQKGIQATGYHYAVLIRTAAATNDLERVETWIQDMKSKSIPYKTVTLNNEMDAYYKSNHLSKVLSLYEQEKSNVKLNVQTFEFVLGAVGRMGDVMKLDQLIFEMSSYNIPRNIDIQNILIRSYERAGDFEKAWKVWQRTIQLGRQTPNIKTFQILVRACALHGQTEKLDQTLQLMKDRNIFANAAFYSSLIFAYMRLRQLDKAIQTLVEMKTKKIPWDGRHRNAFVLSLHKGDVPEMFSQIVTRFKSQKESILPLTPEDERDFQELISSVQL